MNQRTHVWSADEVRTTVPAQLVCAVTEIDLVLKMWSQSKVVFIILKYLWWLVAFNLYLKTLNLIAHYNASHHLTIE